MAARWDRYNEFSSETSWLIKNIDQLTRRAIDTSTAVPVPKSEIEELEDTIRDLKRTNEARALQIVEAKHCQKAAERKLKVILKAIVRLGVYEDLKSVIKKVIFEEKDHIKLAQFFGRHINQLEEFEKELGELE